MIWRIPVLLLVPGLLAGCVLDTPSSGNATQYICADGAQIAALYGKDGDQDNVILSYRGKTFHLIQEMSGSGVRYSWPSDGSNYVWWTKGDSATLYWKDGTKGGAESVVHADCMAQ